MTYPEGLPAGDHSAVRISILTPAYNADTYLRDLLMCVQEQSYDNVEHLVIDDGSTDSTWDILCSDADVVAATQQNVGQYETQNRLLRAARGDVLMVICADDLLADQHVLRDVAAAFRADPELSVVVGRTPRRIEGDVPVTARLDVPLWIGARIVETALSIQHCSIFVRRSLVIEHDLFFDSTYRMRGDWDWIIRVMRASKRTELLSRDVGVWRIHPGQSSLVFSERGTEETLRLLREHGISPNRHRIARLGLTAYARAVMVRAFIVQRGLRFTIARALGRVPRRQAKGR